MQILEEGTLRMAGGIDQAARTADVRTIVLTSVNAGGRYHIDRRKPGEALAKLGRKTLTIDSSGVTPPVAYVTLNLDQSAHRTVGGVHAKKPDVDAWSTAVIAQPFSPKLTPLTNLMDQAFKDLTDRVRYRFDRRRANTNFGGNRIPGSLC